LAIDWTSTPDADHFAQFYDSDRGLAECVAGFVSAGLARGDAAVIIGTLEHRSAILQRLSELDGSATMAAVEGRFIMLDAAATLDDLLVDGVPNPQRFEAVIGGLLRRLKGNGRVRLFGEMVTLLWAAGKREEAMALEQLWNDLGTRHRFALLCAYPLRWFQQPEDAEQFTRICRCHTRVLVTHSPQ
jgi:hypothetical protein